TPSVYHVHAGDKVRDYDEAELAEAIRKGKLTGLELARRDQEEVWEPLFESHVYRREVPSAGDPRDAARWRGSRRLIGHLAPFFIGGVVMFATQGPLPFWMAIWGAVILVQVLRTTPMAWSLFVRRRVGDRAAPPAVPPSETWALPGGVVAGPPSTVA